MEIVTYRKLESKEDIFILLMKSFGFAGTAAWLDKFRKYETRIGDGPVGMCGLIKGKPVGFVGIMNVPTLTRHGEIENVGGIYAVAVRPALARRGIGRKLLEASEEYLRRQGVRLLFLTTSRSIVAYKWYCDTGYEVVDMVDNYPYMYRIFNPPHAVEKRSSPDKKFKYERKQVQKIWDRYSKKHCGFTIRNLTDLKAREMAPEFSKKLSISTDEGYALLEKRHDVTLCIEILARNQKAYRELIKTAESKAKYGLAAIHPFDPTARKAFEKARFKSDFGGYGVLMCKELAGVSFADLYDDNFMISRLDWF